MLIWFANLIFGGVIGEIFAAILSAVVTVFVSVINTIIGWIAWVVFQIATWFVDVAIQMNSQIATSAVIQKGFEMVLLFANLGIIVALVVIAFMVMLRRGDAGKLLTRFVIMALLINFGFYITTNLFIEPVDSITLVINRATNFGPRTFATAFVPTFDVISIEQPEGGGIADITLNEDELALPGLTFDIIVSLVSILFSIAFLVVGTITLFGFAGILFVRYIYLGILVILLPVAWLSWVFPNVRIGGGHPFNQWWGQFTRWLLFAPVSMFFFFLAVWSVNNDALSPERLEGSHYLDDAISGGFATIADMVIIIGLMIGGMIAANSMSIKGASAVLGVAKKASAYAQRYGKRQFAKGTTTALNQPAVKKRLQNLSSAGSGSDSRTIRTLGAIPRAVGRGSMAAAQKGESFIAEDTKKKYQNYAPYRLKALLDNKNLSPIERMAIQSVMHDKKSTWETNIAEFLPEFYEKDMFTKTGNQKLNIGMQKEGLAPAVMASLEREGETFESRMAIMRSVYDQLGDNELAGIATYIMADYDPDTKHAGLTAEQHDELQKLWTTYAATDRADSINRIRSKQLTSGKSNLNKAVQGQLRDDDVRRILSVDKKERAKYVENAWELIKERELGRHRRAINSVKDVKWDKEDSDGKTKRAKELERISANLDNLGPQGYLDKIHALENSQKDLYSALAQGIEGAEAGTPGASVETEES